MHLKLLFLALVVLATAHGLAIRKKAEGGQAAAAKSVKREEPEVVEVEKPGDSKDSNETKDSDESKESSESKSKEEDASNDSKDSGESKDDDDTNDSKDSDESKDDDESNDSKDSSESKDDDDSNDSKDSGESKDDDDSNDSKDSGESKDDHDSNDSKDSGESKDDDDSNDSKDSGESKDDDDSNDSKDSGESKDDDDSNDSKDSGESKEDDESNDSKESGESKDGDKSNDSKDSDESKDKEDSSDSKGSSESKESGDEDASTEGEGEELTAETFRREMKQIIEEVVAAAGPLEHTENLAIKYVIEPSKENAVAVGEALQDALGQVAMSVSKNFQSLLWLFYRLISSSGSKGFSEVAICSAFSNLKLKGGEFADAAQGVTLSEKLSEAFINDVGCYAGHIKDINVQVADVESDILTKNQALEISAKAMSTLQGIIESGESFSKNLAVAFNRPETTTPAETESGDENTKRALERLLRTLQNNPNLLSRRSPK